MARTAPRRPARSESAARRSTVSPRRMIEALREVAVVATRAHRATDIGRVAVAYVEEILGADAAILRWWNAESGRLELLANSHEDRIAGVRSIAAGEGATGTAFAQRAPLVVDDYASWERRLRRGTDAIASCAVVPLLLQDRAVGTLGVYAQEPRRFKETEVQLLSLFAAQLAPIVEAALLRIENERKSASAKAYDGRVRAMLDAALDAHIAADAKGRITAWNPQAEALFGWTRDEILGKELAETIIPEEQRESHRAGLRRYIETGQAALIGHRVELEAVRRNGITFPVEVTITAVATPDGPAFSAFVRDISERRQVDQQLRKLALHDALTALPNRILLYDRAEQAFAAARRHDRPVALLLADLDGFKDINDAFGHHVGDLVLQEVALRLRGAVRDSDTVARLGGDEFAVLLPEADAAGALAAARTLRAALDKPVLVQGVRVTIGASTGVALFPDHGDDPFTLLRRADIAMYAAKRRGSGVALYEEGSDVENAARLGLAADLHDALVGEHLHLHYQPIVSMSTGRVMGLEALARWEHPRFGDVAPDDFIPLAERSGLMPQLTDWALRRAFAKARVWGRDLAIAVNVAVSDIADPQFADRVRAAIESCGIRPDLVHLEVTESGVMSEPERILESLERLRGIGARIAIDDFGTGSSSLAFLHRLPIHACKIDRSFVRRLTTEEASVAIVRATIELAHALDLQVIAEGVEDAPTFALLMRMGCDFAQGHHIAPALPEAKLETWLVESPWGLGAARRRAAT